VKRALWLLPLPVVAIAVASFLGAPKNAARKPIETAAATAPAVSTGPTWVATTTLPHPPRAALAAAAARQAGPKPPTDARTALMDSHPPVVSTLALDQFSSPRERLFAAAHGASPARQAELDRLSGRTAAHLKRLEAARALATGEDRARLDQTIAKLERNQSYRAKVVKDAVHAPARPTSNVGMNVPAPSNKPAPRP
jgi:hypothetical protein